MQKLFANTYFDIFLFVIANIFVSFILKSCLSEEYILLIIDFILIVGLIGLFSYYISKKEISKKKLTLELILIGVSGAFFIAMFNFIYLDMINPAELVKILDENRAQLAEEGYSEEQINNLMNMTKSFTNPTAIAIFGFIGYSISAIISAFISARIFAPSNTNNI